MIFHYQIFRELPDIDAFFFIPGQKQMSVVSVVQQKKSIGLQVIREIRDQWKIFQLDLNARRHAVRRRKGQ